MLNHVRDITGRTMQKLLLAIHSSTTLFGLSYSLKPLCRKNRMLLISIQTMIQISWFYHGSTDDVVHVILRTRLPPFSHVVEKIREPGDKAFAVDVQLTATIR